MAKYLGSLTFVCLFIACGGTTQSEGGNQGGNENGGSSTGGQAGKSTGGTVSTGGSVSSGGFAGGTVDERCPGTRPMGMCTAQDDGATCQYNQFNGCLCYRTGAFVYPCPQVDPSCPATGGGGAGGAASAGAGGVGGISAKVALPPSQVCTCSAGSWTCMFGI